MGDALGSKFSLYLWYVVLIFKLIWFFYCNGNTKKAWCIFVLHPIIVSFYCHFRWEEELTEHSHITNCTFGRAQIFAWLGWISRNREEFCILIYIRHVCFCSSAVKMLSLYISKNLVFIFFEISCRTNNKRILSFLFFWAL